MAFRRRSGCTRSNRIWKKRGIVVRRGGDFDEWDLQIRSGLLSSARLLMAVEEHGQGRQLVRLRVCPQYWEPGLALTLPFIALTIGAGIAGAWTACAAVCMMAALFTLGTVQECEAAMAEFETVLRPSVKSESSAKLIPFDEASKDVSGQSATPYWLLTSRALAL